MAERMLRPSLSILFGAASLIACWVALAAGRAGVWGWMIGAWVFGPMLALVLARGVLTGAQRAGATVPHLASL